MEMLQVRLGECSNDREKQRRFPQGGMLSNHITRDLFQDQF